MRILIAEDDSIRQTACPARSGTMATRSTRCATASRPIPRWPPRPSICSSWTSACPIWRAWKSGACARNSSLPVLILTAADSIEQRVKGLDLAPTTTWPSPSRCPSWRRAFADPPGAGGGATLLKHGRLVFDQTGRVAMVDEQTLDLSAREVSLLEILLTRSGRMVSKTQLVDHLCEWGEEVSTNAIEVYVHRLRKKLEPSGVKIVTVRGLGYCLERDQGAAYLAS